ncbi:MAG: NADH dehydrogenase ubiquinone Fe-S protein 4, partial [Sphingomicrobium sp.]
RQRAAGYQQLYQSLLHDNLLHLSRVAYHSAGPEAHRPHDPSLLCAPRFATHAAMTIARIQEFERRTTQSGNAQAGRWQLEFERAEPLRPDPLTGWNGSGDTRPQVRMGFPSKEAAIAYCRKHKLQFHLVPAAPVTLKIQAYSDNFR